MPSGSTLHSATPSAYSSSAEDVKKVVTVELQEKGGASALQNHASYASLDDEWITDPSNPRNWSLRKKWTNAAIVSFYTFVSPLASSMMAPCLLQIAEQYQVTNQTILAMTLSIFLLGFAVGPLIIAPISEMYGRRWVLHISNILFLFFNIGCAFSPNAGSLIAFRFLTGLAGATPIACGGGSISDLFGEKDRAAAMAIFTLGPLLGPVIGPIAGGFVAQSIGPKYVFIIIAGLSAGAGFVGIPFLHETYAPVLLQRKRAGRGVSDAEKGQLNILPTRREAIYTIWLNIRRPAELLTRSFICFILSLYMSFMYGTPF
ncbi:hypothetical protein HGRIS_009720 [Hohenbuehelia grisea]|uniref:Major facilitator superfamily (MFS) profile domain-containing protein n=1 Tax=Hohenbuehelia grisea TaxID=104357 RepID=A0ABR3J2E7_9AGAR